MLSGIIGEDSDHPVPDNVHEQMQSSSSSSKKKKSHSNTNDNDNSSSDKVKSKLLESFKQNSKAEEVKEEKKPVYVYSFAFLIVKKYLPI